MPLHRSTSRLANTSEHCLGEFLEDQRTDDNSRRMNLDLLQARLAEALAALDYRERAVLGFRFGLTDGYPLTLSEVGSIFSVTRERVRQIEVEAIGKLQQLPAAKILLSFLESPDNPSTHSESNHESTCNPTVGSCPAVDRLQQG